MNEIRFEETSEVVHEVVTLLNRFNVPYLIGGSFASSLRGEFRATNDLDILCRFERDPLRNFVAAATPRFYVDEMSALEALKTGRSFNLIHLTTILKIDLFLSRSEFNDSQLARAKEEKIHNIDLPIRVATAEDIIIQKLFWYRIGGEVSERQLRDVVGVFRLHQERLDRSYLENWANKLGIQDLLERARHME